MADTIQIELSDHSCGAGLEYARRQSAGPVKDAILCCEGMCLKGETARRAANLIATGWCRIRLCASATVACWRRAAACGT